MRWSWRPACAAWRAPPSRPSSWSRHTWGSSSSSRPSRWSSSAGWANIPGAIVAAIGLGLIENWIGGFFEIAWQEGAVFVIMIVVLFLRPDGLFKRGGMRVG